MSKTLCAKGLFREAEAQALGVDAQEPWGKEGHV